MKVQLLLILFNSLLGLVICLPLVSFFHGFGQGCLAYLGKVNIKEISFGFGPIIYIRRAFIVRFFPFWWGIRWDSSELRQKFLSRPQVKNYVQIMSPKLSNRRYFEELAFWQKICLLFSGILTNFVIFGLVFLGMYFAKFHFDLGIFFQSFFRKSFTGFCLCSQGHLIFLRTKNINFVYSFLMMSCFFIMVHFLPIYSLDGQKILAVLCQKITKKSINDAVMLAASIIGMFLLAWTSFGFLLTGQV